MKYSRYIYFLLLLFLGTTSCATKNKFVRQGKVDERAIKKMERKEHQRASKLYKKEYNAWYKLQSPEVQKRLKPQKREINRFGKANTSEGSGECRPRHKKYRKDGIR